MSSVVFQSENHPWDKSQVEIVLRRTVPGDELIALALAKTKPVYYPGKERLVSLDVLKLFREEDVICQSPEDIDPDWWLDEGKLTELPEVPRDEVEVGVIKQPEDQRRPELYPEPDLDILILHEDPEVIAEREGVHECFASFVT